MHDHWWARGGVLLDHQQALGTAITDDGVDDMCHRDGTLLLLLRDADTAAAAVDDAMHITTKRHAAQMFVDFFPLGDPST